MMGFLLVTKPQIKDDKTVIREGMEMPWDGDDLDPYIVFFNAESIHDFNSIGDNLEYLIINYGEYSEDDKKYEMYRVLDDVQDTIIVMHNEKVVDTKTIEHGVGYTPAIQVSNIAKHLVDDKVKTSPIDHVLPALDRYMNKDSDLIIQMVRHMYPKLASVTTECKMCSGDGYYYDDETKKKCKDCNGTGKTIPITRDGVLGLPQYIDEGKTPYPGSPATYIVPDNDSLRIALEDLDVLGKQILYSGTGYKSLVIEGVDTATENLINHKGLEDRIAEIVNMVERTEEFLIQTCAKMHGKFKNGFDNVSVRYGRRLSVRGENEILEEIQNARDAGMPISHIESLQKELIYTRYKNNPVELERHILLADVEPLNTYTVGDISDIEAYVDNVDMTIKVNYNSLIDWFEATHGPVNKYNEGMDYKKRVESIYNILRDEVLRIAREAGQDGGQNVQVSDAD
jgi:hypothetical protein